MKTTVANKRIDRFTPEDSVDVTRDSKTVHRILGNPYRKAEAGDLAVPLYAAHFAKQILSSPEFVSVVESCRGKRLFCICRPEGGFGGKVHCHAQIIAAYLNECTPEEVT